VHVLQTTAQVDALLDRIAALIKAGHTAAARSLLIAARRMAAPSAQQAELSVRLAVREGHPELAQQELDAAIADTPAHPGLRKLRAELRRDCADYAGAAADAAEAVVLDPSDPVAKALLGVLLLDLQRVDDAVTCLREAVASQPSNAAFREALAAALNAAGDSDAAFATLITGIAAAPGHIGLRNAAVLHCIRRREFSAALQVAEAARVAGVVDACLFGLMGHALSSLQRHEEAAVQYREALKLGPEDPYVRHLVASTGSLPGGRGAPVEYVRTVFDGYADHFESHLISLAYRVPGLFRAALLDHPAIVAGEAVGPVVDLGCGTGLLAVVLSDLAIGPLVGVDVSAKMLAQAAAKQLYRDLKQAEIIEFLHHDPTSWPIILAADVLCYFGALDEVFAAVRARLVRGGWFVFSVELLNAEAAAVGLPHDDGWALGRQGRYGHRESCIARSAAAAGLAIRSMRAETLRQEAGMPVAGLLVVLERPRDDH
jgi:predicted TPR repeat methyltransferase